MSIDSTQENIGRDASDGGKGTHSYRVQIDKQFYDVKQPTITGRELLELAGKNPPEQFALYLKTKAGGQPVRIALDQTVDLREPGTERFVTLPLDQTEG